MRETVFGEGARHSLVDAQNKIARREPGAQRDPIGIAHDESRTGICRRSAADAHFVESQAEAIPVCVRPIWRSQCGGSTSLGGGDIGAKPKRAAVAPNVEHQARARRACRDPLLNRGEAHGHGVSEPKDDVPDAQAAVLRLRGGCHARHQRAVCTRVPERAREADRYLLKVSGDPPSHKAICIALSDRKRKRDSHEPAGRGVDTRVDADDLAFEIE